MDVLTAAESRINSRQIYTYEAFVAISEMPFRESVISFALRDPSIWNPGVRDEARQAVGGSSSAILQLYDHGRLGIPLFALHEDAENRALADGVPEIRESHLVRALAALSRTANTGVHLDQLCRKVDEVEIQWDIEETPPTDVIHEIAEELDLLNQAFSDGWNVRPFTCTAFRTMLDLSQPCENVADFTTRVELVAGILDDVDLQAHVPQGIKGGPISHLVNFLSTKGRAVDAGVIQSLRDLHSIRNSYPVHLVSNHDQNAAHKRIGLTYPVTDYAAGGRRINLIFRGALRRLRMSVI